MKRKILASLLGMATALAVTSAHAQGKINLDNYDSTPSNPVTYGAGSGGTVGAGIVDGTPSGTWTIGFYYALGDVTGSVGSDSSHVADPSSLGGGLGFATGVAGDTTGLALPGLFAATGDGVINGWTAGVVTVEVVAYNGTSYLSANTTTRGHSTAFTITPAGTGSPTPLIGTVMPGFSVFAVPEPSTFALAGLGAAALMAFRRKKQA